MKLLPALLVACLLSLAACSGRSPIAGIWHNDLGQTMAFDADSSLVWIFQDSSGYDTFKIYYRYNPATSPAELDLFGFAEGPLAGKTLYGIASLLGKDTLRVDFELGPGPQVRPKDFDRSQAQTFVRVPSNLD